MVEACARVSSQIRQASAVAPTLWKGVGATLISKASEFYDIDPKAICSRRKHGEITPARRAVAHVLIENVGWSALRVAKLFGQRHPSILDGYRRSKEMLRTDPVFFEAVERLKQELFHDYRTI